MIDLEQIDSTVALGVVSNFALALLVSRQPALCGRDFSPDALTGRRHADSTFGFTVGAEAPPAEERG